MQSIHDTIALEEIRRRRRIEPNDLRRMRNAFYKDRRTAQDALDRIPAEQRSAFDDIAFHSLTLRQRHDSQRDGASKLLFSTTGGDLIEAVILRIATGRTTLCVSSQAGCAVRCGFCATGRMKEVHDLSPNEILDQVIQANQLLAAEGRKIRNVVFMGMGEPLHNEDAVCAALDVLLSPKCFGLSPAHVLVSTVGIPEAMLRLAERYPRMRLAFSLHSARQEVRERIIPLARRYPLDVLHAAVIDVTARTGRSVMIEVLLLEGVNDAEEDARALIDYLQGLNVLVNLIPYNPIDAAPELRGVSQERRLEFARALQDGGLLVRTRYSLGSDIAAACGQLAHRG